jgi:hypothetical protein
VPLLFKVNNINFGTLDSDLNNVSFGRNILGNNTEGDYNVALGSSLLSSGAINRRNVAMGDQVLKTAYITTQNIGIGSYIMDSGNRVSNNIGIGSSLLRKVYSNGIFPFGMYNIALGNFLLQECYVCAFNIALGAYSVSKLENGSDNIALGQNVFLEAVSGYGNIGIGKNALRNGTQLSGNIAIGRESMLNSGTGNNNVSVGEESMYKNATGSNNVSIGYRAISNNTSGSYNVGMGDYVLREALGEGLVGVGSGALLGSVNGNYNTALGFQAGRLITNTINNTMLLGNNAGFATTTSNQVNVGNASVLWIGGQVNWGTYSDARIKDHVKENVPGLSFITRLKPVTYHLNLRKQYAIGNLGAEDTSPDFEGKYDIEQITQSGFLAQDVAQAAKSVGYDFNGVQVPKNGEGLYSLTYASFVVPLVKAVQEQQEEISALKKQLHDEQQDNKKKLEELELLVRALMAEKNK